MAKTIEEKAKAYDKALAKFRESLGKHDLVGVNRGYLESIFSELKEEPENEKIRKEIIDFVKNSHNYWQPNNSIAKKWVAWLEKQSDEAKIEALRTEYEKGKADAIAEIEKPEWSDEDEYQYNTILHTLNMRKYVHEKKGDEEEAKRYEVQSNWLKSLKNRVQPQPKREWSKEDKDIINSLVSFLENELSSSKTNEDRNLFKRQIEIVKSLLPQK